MVQGWQKCCIHVPLTGAHTEQQQVFVSMPGERHPGLPGIWHLQPYSLFGNAGNLTDSRVSQPLLVPRPSQILNQKAARKWSG